MGDGPWIIAMGRSFVQDLEGTSKVQSTTEHIRLFISPVFEPSFLLITGFWSLGAYADINESDKANGDMATALGKPCHRDEEQALGIIEANGVDIKASTHLDLFLWSFLDFSDRDASLDSLLYGFIPFL